MTPARAPLGSAPQVCQLTQGVPHADLRRGRIYVREWASRDGRVALIHEYLHKLAHKDYGTYAQKLGGEASTAGSTLIEGVDSLLSEIAWKSALPRTKLNDVRQAVEPDAVAAGKPYNENLLPVMPARAETYEGAVRLVSVVGIRNLYAAYFQGRVDLIGGTVT